MKCPYNAEFMTDDCNWEECKKFKQCEKETLAKMSKKERNELLHMGCPAFPFCKENPTGCFVKMGSNTEMFGHKE